MAMSITRSELERLRRIEKLAREAVAPNSPEEHQQALNALRKALDEQPAAFDRDAHRGAITQRIIPNESRAPGMGIKKG